MTQEFVCFVPGLMGVEAHIDYSGEPEKVRMLRESGAAPHLLRYQTHDKRAPTYNEMCLAVANQIANLQRKNGTNGKVIASSVGAGILRDALPILAQMGCPMPDVIPLNPVWNNAAGIRAQAGSHINAFLDRADGVLPIRVSGEHNATYPLTRESFLQAEHAAMQPTPELPSFTLLTGQDDPFCNAEMAAELYRTVNARRKLGLVLWQGGHNENNAERDHDIVQALSNALRTPSPTQMLGNIVDRSVFVKQTPARLRKRSALHAAFSELRQQDLTAEQRRHVRARINIMRRVRTEPSI